jgi:biopolymer transport protein ExbB/TolQ
MILANATPDPQAFMQFWLTISLLASVGSGVVGIAAFFSSRRVQKREVSFTREYASKEELTHLLKDLERFVASEAEHRSEMKATLADLRAEMKAGQAEVRAEMKADRTLIMAAADARFEKVVQRVDRLLDGMNRVQGRLQLTAEP